MRPGHLLRLVELLLGWLLPKCPRRCPEHPQTHPTDSPLSLGGHTRPAGRLIDHQRPLSPVFTTCYCRHPRATSPTHTNACTSWSRLLHPTTISYGCPGAQLSQADC